MHLLKRAGRTRSYKKWDVRESSLWGQKHQQLPGAYGLYLIQTDIFWMKRPLLQYFGNTCVLSLPEHGISNLMLDQLFFSFSDWGSFCVDLENTLVLFSFSQARFTPGMLQWVHKVLECKTVILCTLCISFFLCVCKLLGNVLKCLQLCNCNTRKGETVFLWGISQF